MAIRKVLCFEFLPAVAEGAAPDWIELIPRPVDGVVRGRDGRAYALRDPVRVLDAFVKRALDLAVDINHSSEINAPQGGESPAVGWVKELVIKAGGAIWGRVNWTDAGQGVLAQKKYKYISPAFFVDSKKTDKKAGVLGEITELTSIGLTNQPNFDLPALNSEQQDTDEAKSIDNANNSEDKMDKKILEALGLPENATEQQAIDKIAELAAAAKKPVLASQDQIAAAVNAAVQPFKEEAAKIKEQAAKTRSLAVATTIDRYVALGKIQPTDDAKKFWMSACGQTDEALETVVKFLDAAPAIVSTNARLPITPGTAADANALTDNQIKICNMLQISQEDYKKALATKASS